METTNLTTESTANEQLVSRIERLSGVNLRDCYQCGKCAAGCPVAPHADMTCRQLIRNLQLGVVDPVLHATMPWQCLSCGVCVARCPQSVDMPSLMVAVKRVATEQGIVASCEAKVFDDVFLGVVGATGISDEVLLAGGYNMLSGHMFQDVASVPAMMKKGLIEVALPSKVERTDEIKALFARCKQAEQERGGSEGSHE